MRVKVHVFWLGHFARSKIKSESIFLITYYIITILKKWSILAYISKSQKKDFPVYFQILRGRVRVFFQARKLSLGQMACIYLLNSREGPQIWILSSPLIVIPYLYMYSVLLYFDTWCIVPYAAPVSCFIGAALLFTRLFTSDTKDSCSSF